MEQVRDQVQTRVRVELTDLIKSQLEEHVLNPVRTQVQDQLGRDATVPLRIAAYGQHDAAWLAWYDFFHAVCQVRGPERLTGLIRLTQSGGWYWLFHGGVLLTERPSHLLLDDDGRLHAEDEMAIQYSDGWRIYCWHGVRVTEQVILRPSELTPIDIEAEPNAEIRRIMLQRYGEARFLRDSRRELLGDEPPATECQMDPLADASQG